MALPEDGDLPGRARAKGDAPGTGLLGVARDVEDRLNELLAVADDLRDARVVVALELDAELALDQAAHPLEDLVDADGLDARRAVRGQHAIHQALQAIGLLDDHLRVLAQLGLVQLALEELGRAAQPAERILDLMGEIADQLAVRLLLEDQALLARVAQLLFDRAQLGKQPKTLGID